MEELHSLWLMVTRGPAQRPPHTHRRRGPGTPRNESPPTLSKQELNGKQARE
jgi:hypothetical protein